MFVKNTSTVPSFQMAYTDPTKDVDVSGQMEHGGVVEIGLTMMWYKALKDKCVHRDGSRALVVDVGGNFGWYSIYAATLGCRSALCSELSFEFCVGNQGKLLIACTILATPCLHAMQIMSTCTSLVTDLLVVTIMFRKAANQQRCLSIQCAS